MATRQLLEDIRSLYENIGMSIFKGKGKTSTNVMGIKVDIKMFHQDEENEEWGFDVNHQGQEIGYYMVHGDAGDVITNFHGEAYSENGDSTDEYNNHNDFISWLVSSALEDGLISEGMLDKAKQMAMKFLKKSKKKISKKFKWSKGLKQAASKKGLKL